MAIPQKLVAVDCRGIRADFAARLADAVAKASRRTILKNEARVFHTNTSRIQILPVNYRFYRNARQTANFSRGIHMRHIQPAKPIPTAGKKPAQKVKETVTLRHLATAMAEGHGLPKAKANAMLTDMVAAVTRHLKKGARIRVNGLGIFQVRKRPARMGRNPATGEAIRIKASKKIAFRAARDLKQAI
jgi:DNA-binding protein HU-beta